MIKNFQGFVKISFLLVSLIMFLFLSGNLDGFNVSAESTADAIAVRVLPNPKHYSALRWYQEQGFSGSPEQIVVDGYDGVRDGRTVYVNVANVSGVCTHGGECSSFLDCWFPLELGAPIPYLYNFCEISIFTNIYLISYNQDSSQATLNIFDKILEKWKFNSNYTETGVCFDNSNITCLADTDCGDGDFCSSFKARITRDTKRLADVVELKEAIIRYKSSNGNYPKLTAGTYLPGKTLSVWPSWRTVFSNEIGMMAPVDPVNRLGDCADDKYDKTTCWDDEGKSFYGDIPDNLPPLSKVFVYSVDDNGLSYELCATMESELFADGRFSEACVSDFIENTAPRVECGSLFGTIGEDFEGFVSASDTEGDNLTFEINDLPYGFSFMGTDDKNKKKIYSSNVSDAKDYNFTVVVWDGSVFSEKECKITVYGDAFTLYPIEDQRVLVGEELSLVIYANSSNKDYENISFTFEGGPTGFGSNPEFSRINADGRYEHKVQRVLHDPKNLNIKVKASNGAGETAVQDLKVEVYNNPPVVGPVNCKTEVRVGDEYECIIDVNDIDGHRVKEAVTTGLSQGVKFVLVPGSKSIKLTHKFIEVGKKDIKIKVIDYYGAESEEVSFQLAVNDYCGDGERQSPNSEGRGGPENTGYEDCDGEEGLPSIKKADASWQYGCEPDCSSSQGGWCGDGIAQDGLFSDFTGGKQFFNDLTFNHGLVDYNEECDFGETINCCEECKWTSPNTKKIIVETVTFSKDDMSSKEIKFPPSRGITGGYFIREIVINPDENEGGVEIIFVTDLSKNGYATAQDYKDAIGSAINELYKQANKDNVNIRVGLLAHGCPYGNCGEATSDNVIITSHDISNLRNMTGDKGNLNKKTLIKSMEGYVSGGDFSGSNSGLPEAVGIAKGKFSNNESTKKYMIILSDGVFSTDLFGKADGYITNARDAGIETYVISYTDKEYTACTAYNKEDTWNICHYMKQMCKMSNDAGIGCYSEEYSFSRNKTAEIAVSPPQVKPDGDNFDGPIPSGPIPPGMTIYGLPLSGTTLQTPVEDDSIFRSDSTEASIISAIYNKIIKQILSDKPEPDETIEYTVEKEDNYGEDTGYISTIDGPNENGQYHFKLKDVICDESGIDGCNPAFINFAPKFEDGIKGSSKVVYDFIFDVVPICERNDTQK